MPERLVFHTSGLIKDKSDLSSIEFWGHDAGEFSLEEANDLIEKVETVDEKEEVDIELEESLKEDLLDSHTAG